MPDPTHTVQSALRYMAEHPELPDEMRDHVANLTETVDMLEKRLDGSTDQNGRHIRMIVELRNVLLEGKDE